MTRLWPDGEPIAVTCDSWNVPQRFVWQGRTHPVQNIQQSWQVDTDWWRAEGRIWRDYFALTTETGLLCVLFYDWLGESWRLSKVYD